MFFRNQKMQSEILNLEGQISALKQELEQKNQTISNLETELANKPKEEDCEAVKEELALFKAVASVSQEEGLVVFDEKKQVIFTNTLAKHNIKDYSIVLEAVVKGEERLIMDDCEANMMVKDFKGNNRVIQG